MSSLVVRFTSRANAWRCFTAACNSCLVRGSGVLSNERRAASVMLAALVLGATDCMDRSGVSRFAKTLHFGGGRSHPQVFFYEVDSVSKYVRFSDGFLNTVCSIAICWCG